MSNNERNMNDERLKMLIQRELAGEIQPEEEAELQQALGENQKLAAVYGEERRLSALLAQNRDTIVPPAGLAGSIADRILATDSKAPLGKKFDFASYLRPLVAVACLLIVVGSAFWVGRQSVQAGGGDSGAGLLRMKQVLLEEHPELNPVQVNAIYDTCAKTIEAIDSDGEKRRIEAHVTLEREIGELLLKARHKDAESK